MHRVFTSQHLSARSTVASTKAWVALTSIALLTLPLSACASSHEPEAHAQESSSQSTSENRASKKNDGAASVGQSMILDEILANYHLSGLDARGIIDLIEEMPINDKPVALDADVHSGELVLTDTNSNSARMPLPAGQAYLALAPYHTNSASCTIHSLTRDLSDAPNTPMHVKITNSSGSVLVDQDMVSAPSGFIGIWLEKNTEGTVEVSTDSAHATSHFSTQPGSSTCVSDLHLQ